MSCAVFAVSLVAGDNRNYPDDAVVQMFVAFTFISCVIFINNSAQVSLILPTTLAMGFVSKHSQLLPGLAALL
jgi:hypothetical protein